MKAEQKKPPVLAQLLLRKITRSEESFSVFGDLEEEYNEIAGESGILRAQHWYWKHTINSVIPFMVNSFIWNLIMLKNFLKVAFRYLIRQKGYSFITISGLATGIACCILIFLYVSYEYSYDDYHRDPDRIFRVTMMYKTNAMHNFRTVWSAPPIVPALREGFAEVEAAVRAKPSGECRVKCNENEFYETDFIYAEPEIFNIFSIQFIQGKSSTALVRPRTIIITEDIAEKYFKGENPVGALINVNDRDFEITGVVENCPVNTHLQYNLIASFASFELNDGSWMEMSSWGWAGFFSYIKLKPGVDAAAFGEKIRHLAYQYAKEELAAGGFKEHNCLLQPVGTIHLQSFDKRLYLYIFSTIGVLILLIACLNFINITTARSANRAKEIGVRKVVGAFRFQLIKQFISESILTFFISFIAALILTSLVLPFFNRLAGTEFTEAYLFQSKVIFPSLGIALFSGISAGSYPAFILSGFKPVMMFRSRMKTSSGGSVMRKILVVIQFTASILLIISTITIFRQVNFMRDKNLGFEIKQKLVVPFDEGENYRIYKNEFLKHPSVVKASVSNSVPGKYFNNYTIKLKEQSDDEYRIMDYLHIDCDFLSQYGIETAAGRAFLKEMSADVRGNTYMINETAVRILGFNSPDEALGKLLVGQNGQHEIVGVVRDFHYEGLQRAIQPLVLNGRPDYNYITLTLNTTNLDETLSFIKGTWKKLFPGDVFRFSFLDAEFDQFYQSEKRLGRIFLTFAILAIAISSLGLFGLVAFIAEQRTKEIGIRKVLGASVTNIMRLLSNEFIVLVAIANIIAWPIAYYAISRWLHNFAYRTTIPIWLFIISGILALLIALLTVGFQTIKASLANPVDALKYE